MIGKKVIRHNLSGSNKAYKPNKISKKKNLKIMKLGKIKISLIIFVFGFFSNFKF